MGRGPKKMTEALIAQWQKEGRGKGEGPKYKPWLEVFDFSSIGRVERTESARFGRTIHLMSDVERDTFYAAEYSQRVLDAREQYPLDREITLEIAKYLNIRHPYYPGTDVPTVMTVDFFCKVVRNGVPGYEAIDCKRTEAAEDTHAIEKLQITRTYFAGMDVPHRLVFHSRLPKTHIRNIEWMRSGLIKSGEQERYPATSARSQASWPTNWPTLRATCRSMSTARTLKSAMVCLRQRGCASRSCSCMSEPCCAT